MITAPSNCVIGLTTLADCFTRGEHALVGIELTAKRVKTNAGMLHKDGHPEPWFIAIADTPSTARTFDYGLSVALWARVDYQHQACWHLSTDNDTGR